MTQFKVGDRVRYDNPKEIGWHGVTGTIAPETFKQTEWTYFYPDEDQVHPNDGAPISAFYRKGMGAGMERNRFVLIEKPHDELTALRAFKEQAIARYPDLAEPESDEDAAKRFADEWEDGTEGLVQMMPRIFAWARANPR